MTHTPNHLSERSPMPTLEGPSRDNPTAGPETGTMWRELSSRAAAGASGTQLDPGSKPPSTCPEQAPMKSRGAKHPVGEGTMGTGKPTGALGATGPDEPQQTKAGRQGTP